MSYEPIATLREEARVSAMMRRIHKMFDRYFLAEELDRPRPSVSEEELRGALVPGPAGEVPGKRVYKKRYTQAVRVAQAWAWSQRHGVSLRSVAKRWDVPFSRVLSYNRQRRLAAGGGK